MSERARKTVVFVCVVLAHAMLGWLSMRWPYVPSSADQEWHGTLFLVTERQQRKSDEPRPRGIADAVSNNVIAEEPEIESSAIASEQSVPVTDWRTSIGTAVDAVVARQLQEQSRRSLMSKPKTLELPNGKARSEGVFEQPAHGLGDSQQFEGGEVITWVSGKCYYANRSSPSALRDNERPTPVPICKGNAGKPPIRGDLFDEIKPEYLRTLPDSREQEQATDGSSAE